MAKGSGFRVGLSLRFLAKDGFWGTFWAFRALDSFEVL